MRHRTWLVALGLGLSACATERVTTERVERGTAVEHGEFLFSDHSASPAALNVFSCSTCHHAGSPEPSDTRILPGANLAGAPERGSFWGGQVNDLLWAINDCRRHFMGAREPWTSEEEEAKAMWAYLASLPPTYSNPMPFSVVGPVQDLPKGDASRGEAVYGNACHACHGDLHTGKGRPTSLASKLPDDPVAEHVGFSDVDQRVIFIEKIRHGGFLGYAGSMPPFSSEALSDAQMADLLTYLGLY